MYYQSQFNLSHDGGKCVCSTKLKPILTIKEKNNLYYQNNCSFWYKKSKLFLAQKKCNFGLNWSKVFETPK